MRLWRPRSWVEQCPPPPKPANSTSVEPPISIEAAQDMLRDLRRLWLAEAAARVEALPTLPIQRRRLNGDGSSNGSQFINRRDALAAIMRDDA